LSALNSVLAVTPLDLTNFFELSGKN